MISPPESQPSDAVLLKLCDMLNLAAEARDLAQGRGLVLVEHAIGVVQSNLGRALLVAGGVTPKVTPKVTLRLMQGGRDA